VATGLPSLLQAFFTDRLLRQQRASPNTVAGYRDSFRLLFRFAKERLSKAPSNLTIEDLNVSFIGDFLDHLENRRKNSARTRNIRLAWSFAHLRKSFRPFHKGLEEFSGVRIQGGVAENPFLPSRVT
jgi:Phage integrase SAM-like domain